MSRLRAARELARGAPPSLPSPLCMVLYFPVIPRSLCCRAGQLPAASTWAYRPHLCRPAAQQPLRLDRLAHPPPTPLTSRDSSPRCPPPPTPGQAMRTIARPPTHLTISSYGPAMLFQPWAGACLAAARVPSGSQRSDPSPCLTGVSSPRSESTTPLRSEQ